jgi:hypothetical protein
MIVEPCPFNYPKRFKANGGGPIVLALVALWPFFTGWRGRRTTY